MQPVPSRDGYHFSHHNNRFWPVLHWPGSPTCACSQHQRRLLDYGCGSLQWSATDAGQPARFPPKSSAAHDPNSSKDPPLRPSGARFSRKAGAGLHARCVRRRLGPVSPGFAGAEAWVLPNPSGLNLASRSSSSSTRIANYVKPFRHPERQRPTNGASRIAGPRRCPSKRRAGRVASAIAEDSDRAGCSRLYRANRRCMTAAIVRRSIKVRRL